VTWTVALDEPYATDLAEATAVVGGKAANLGVMARDLGLPVPPGFAITTAACRAFLADGWPDGLDDELRTRMSAVEAAVRRGFGDARDPLLVSVRSGAPVSMPGMMDTILDLGLNEATTAGLAQVSGDEAFANACRERFETSFRSIVGVDTVPDDSWAQLRLAIEAVFRSWNGDRARSYRAREAIADDLGTGVTVQAMVFGNRGGTSGTGVVFTRNPASGEPGLYGDVLFDAQGDDVVAGTHATEPISALDERLPDVAGQLRDVAGRLEHHYRDLCDIEFTIEDGRLWLLQVRVGKRSPQAALRMAVDMATEPDFPLSRAEAVERVRTHLTEPPRTGATRDPAAMPILRGLPASPGIASGPIVTDPEAAVRAAEAGRRAILVRAETSPDDVHGMAAAAGILTSRGGLASHAAVVARGWGIPAVVGAGELEVTDGRVTVGSYAVAAGDQVTIDGSTGEVFEGAIGSTGDVVPEVAILLGWARELGIADGVTTTEPSPVEAGARAGSGGRAVSTERLVRVLAIKGFAQPQALADALLTTPEALQPVLDRLVADGSVAAVAGAYRLTDVGATRATAALEADREAWGTERANAALDGFLELDGRMKSIVTAWQLRDADAQVINDHTDLDYDRQVIEDLGVLHADATAWLIPLESQATLLGDYRARLDRAAEQAIVGDGRFVASPRVDSYHGAWFELHEELIQLAGRTRADEVAAGRA
jgi:pyruvate,orthophosphate dikinase